MRQRVPLWGCFPELPLRWLQYPGRAYDPMWVPVQGREAFPVRERRPTREWECCPVRKRRSVWERECYPVQKRRLIQLRRLLRVNYSAVHSAGKGREVYAPEKRVRYQFYSRLIWRQGGHFVLLCRLQGSAGHRVR